MDRRAKPYYYLSAADVAEDEDEFTSSFTRDDVAKFLISILCKTKGKATLSALAAKHYQPLVRSGVQSVEQLRTFCEAYPQSFVLRKVSADGAETDDLEVETDDLEVEVTAEVRVCSMHVRRAGSCPDDGECGCLHVCKFFILSGKCEFSTKAKVFCHFGHKLANDHNRAVLKSRLMDHLKLRELRTLVRRRCARSPVTRPNVCFYYNSKAGCSKGLRCNALHVCRNFIFGQCKFGDNCNRCHDLIDPSIIFILDQYGIDVEDLAEFMQDAQLEVKPKPRPPLPGILGPVPSSLPASSSIMGWGGPATQLSDHSLATQLNDHGPKTRPSDQQKSCRDGDGETSGFGRPGPSAGRDGEGSGSGKPSPRVGPDDGGHRSNRPRYGRDSQSPQFKGHRTWSRERGSRSGQDSDSSRSRRGSNSPMPGLMSPPSDRNHGNWSHHVSEKQGTEGCAPTVYQTLFSRRRGHVVNSASVENTSLDTAQSQENCHSSEAEDSLPTPFNPFTYLKNPNKPAVTATAQNAQTVMKASSQRPENVAAVAVAQSWGQLENTQTSVAAPAIHTTQVMNTTQGMETSVKTAMQGMKTSVETAAIKTTQGMETSVETAAINTTQGMETSVETAAINTTQGMETSVETAAINTTQGMEMKCRFPARRATEDLLFGRPKERSFLPACDSDGSLGRARAAVRPVVSVMPQVQTKPQPVCSTPHWPGSKVVDDPGSCVGVVFGQQAQDLTPANSDEQKTSATTNSNVESLGASTSSGVTQPAPPVSNEPPPSTASPLATNLQSIIAGLISNVQKLHSHSTQAAEPESHFVSYLSELAQPDKLTADVKSQVDNEGRMKVTLDVKSQVDNEGRMKVTLDDVDGESDNDQSVRRSPEQLQYLSDGEISDSENDADAASKKAIPVVPQEPMLFDYNHRPTTDMLSRMLHSPGNSPVKEVTAKSHLGAGEGGASVRVEEKDTEEPDSAAKTNKQGWERKGRSSRQGRCRCKGKRGARKRCRSGQEMKAGGIEYDDVDSPEEEELELIDSSEGDMSDHHSCDQHHKTVSDRISKGDNSQDRVHSARQSSAPRSYHSPQRSSQGHGMLSPGPWKTSRRWSPDQKSAHSDGANRGEYNGSGLTERRSPFRSVSSPTREDWRPHENMFDSGVTSRAEPPKLTALRSQSRSQERSVWSLNGSPHQRLFKEDAGGPSSERMWQQETDPTHRHCASLSWGGSLGGGSEGGESHARGREELRQASVTDTLTRREGDTLTRREGSLDSHPQLGHRPSPFSGEREIESLRIGERSPLGSQHHSLGFRDRSVEGSVHRRLGPSPVPSDHLHTGRGHREGGVSPDRYHAGFEDTEHDLHTGRGHRERDVSPDRYHAGFEDTERDLHTGRGHRERGVSPDRYHAGFEDTEHDLHTGRGHRERGVSPDRYHAGFEDTEHDLHTGRGHRERGVSPDRYHAGFEDTEHDLHTGRGHREGDISPDRYHAGFEDTEHDLHTGRGHREGDISPDRYHTGFEDTERDPHRPGDEEPEWCEGVGVSDVSETCGSDAFPLGRGPTLSPKRFANYEDWKRAHSKVSANGKGRPVTKPDILFSSLCSEEERYGRQGPVQAVRDENRHDAMFNGRCQDEVQRYSPSKLSPLHEQHHQHEQRREDRHRLDHFQVYHESQPHSPDFSGRSHGPTPPRLHRSAGRDLRAEESRNSSRCRREGFDGGDGGQLRENVNHLLDRAQHISGSRRSTPHGDPRSSIPRDQQPPRSNMMLDEQPPTFEVELHDTGDSAPGLCHQATQRFHAHKRRGDERQQQHARPTKRRRLSPPREQGRNTILRDRHSDSHPVHNRDTKSGRRKIRDRDPGHRDIDQVQRDRDPGHTHRDTNQVQRDRDPGHTHRDTNQVQRDRDPGHIYRDTNQIQRDRDPGHRDTDEVQRDQVQSNRDPGRRDRDSGRRDTSRQRSRDREITRDDARRRGRNHSWRDEKDTFQRSPRLRSPGNRTGDKSHGHRSNSGERYNTYHPRQRSVRSGGEEESPRRHSRDRLQHKTGIQIKMVFNPEEEAYFGDSGHSGAEEKESLPPYRDLDLPGVEDQTGFEGQPLYDTVDENGEEFHEEGGYGDSYDDNYGDDFGGGSYSNDYGDFEEGYENNDDGYGDRFGGEVDGDFQGDDLENMDGGEGTGIGSGFEDVGDLIQARAAHCHPDLRSRLQNRHRSRLLIKAKAEGLQIRVNRGRDRRQQSNKSRYLGDIDRQVIA